MHNMLKNFYLTSTLISFLGAVELEKYDASKIADVFYQLSGDTNNPHKKINHTKGFCALGEFIPNPKATKRFDIPLLRENSIPTQARFSLGGGNPNESDKSKARGLALKIQGAKDSFETVMLNTEINFAKDPDEFGTYFALRVPKNGKVDTEKLAYYTENVHSFKQHAEYMKNLGITPSVANTTYYSIHTFYVKEGEKWIPARWKFVPTQGEKTLSEAELKTLGENFLEQDFKTKIAKKPITYTMLLVLANPNDITDQTTALWSGKHTEIPLGTLKINTFDGTSCNQDVFMPNILPQGISEPKDPLFDVRNAVYGITFGRRQ